MTPRSRAFRPGAACLEPRALLSVAEVANPAFTKALLSASFQGRYQSGQDHRAADAPMHVKLTGAGPKQDKTRLAGTLNFGGFRVANAPDITGTLTLTGPKGTIKLQVTGSGGNSRFPNNHYSLNVGIVKATGAYAHAQGVGRLTLNLGADTARGKAVAGPATFDLDMVAPVR